MRMRRPVWLASLLTSLLVGHLHYGHFDVAHAEDMPRERIDRSEFSMVSSGAEIRMLLKAAQAQQAAALDHVKSWRGEGLLEVWFVVPMLRIPAAGGGDGGFEHVDGPFEVNRASNLSFLWSAELKSLRCSMDSIPPTKCTALGDPKVRHELHEGLAINCLVRPDGFYRMQPNRWWGEFEGFPKSLPQGQQTRVVERRPGDVAMTLRGSDVFDPLLLLEIGGQQVDELCDSYLRIVSTPELSGRFTLRRRSDGALLAAMQYVDSADAEPSLTCEVIFDSLTSFLPKEAVFKNRQGDVLQSLSWDYSGESPALVPTRFEHVKFNETGARVSKRSVTITEFEVNGPVLGSDFELSSIGVRDGDRLLDRIEKKLSLIQGTRP